MKERPILFSAPMVRAIIDGKTLGTLSAQPLRVRLEGLRMPFVRGCLFVAALARRPLTDLEERLVLRLLYWRPGLWTS